MGGFISLTHFLKDVPIYFWKDGFDRWRYDVRELGINSTLCSNELSEHLDKEILRVNEELREILKSAIESYPSYSFLKDCYVVKDLRCPLCEMPITDKDKRDWISDTVELGNGIVYWEAYTCSCGQRFLGVNGRTTS